MDKLIQQYDMNAFQEILKTIDPMMKMIIPVNVGEKSFIGLLYLFIEIVKNKFIFLKNCIVFVNCETDENSIRKFVFDLLEYLNSLTEQEKRDLSKMLGFPIDVIIRKDFKLLNLNLSETINRCKQKIGETETQEGFSSIKILFDKILISKIKDISLIELIKYLDKIKK